MQRGPTACRFFKGGVDCPFPADDLRATAWKFERLWCYADDDLINECLADYVRLGMGDFHKDDDVPVTLKAFLMDRFFYHWGREDIPEFKAFYDATYK